MRFYGMMSGFAVVLLAGSFLFGDDKKDAPRVRGTLPANWSKLGLTDDQRQQIYTAQSEYRAKIDELQKQIKKLQREERVVMEKVLTEAQKARLRELLAEKGPGGSSSKEDKKPESNPEKKP
jgi:hypothetical protein